MLFVAPASPIVLGVAARPAYENGTLVDWVPWLLAEQKMEVITMGAGEIGPHDTFVGSARQAADVGPGITRFAFLEDGGRLVNISMIAPEAVSPELEDVWSRVLKTFRLKNVRGSVSAPRTKKPDKPVYEEAEVPPPPEPEAAPPKVVDWIDLARQLEASDQLDEMEELVRRNINHQSFAITIAELYRDRAGRLNQAGDVQRAAEAIEKARNWAMFYASQATSAGEGEALSRERDAFLATL